MGKLATTDVLIALAGCAGRGPVDGTTVHAAVSEGIGRTVGADRVLTRMLEMETSGHVRIDRHDGYRFSLTPSGERAAADLVGGAPVEVALLMMDLVGFVAYTADHGDEAGHDAADGLRTAAEKAMADVGGRVVKSMGDGFLATAPPDADLAGPATTVAESMRLHDGTPWPIRGAVHRGVVIECRGDLFGNAVNLVARLCDHAAADQLIRSVAGGDATEELDVRGFAEPAAIERLALR